MLVAPLVLLPVILAYTALAYWLFHGKVAERGVSLSLDALAHPPAACQRARRQMR